MQDNTNISKMSAGKAARLLAGAYTTLIQKGIEFKTFPGVMLWSPPGCGKSQLVREMAELIETETKRKVIVTDVRLLLFNPIDLRGIPTANEDKTEAVWLRPQIFNMNPNPDVVNVLFLDELSAAPQSVQAAAYQIVLDRTIGEHCLPDNCIVIAAGNRVTDKSVAFKMPKALANRLMHIEIESNFESFKEWALKKGIHEKVIAFLSFRQDLLMCFDPSTDDLAFPTPRAWEMVSNLLNNVNENVEAIYPLICGIIGSGTAFELKNYERIYSKLPSIEAIFDGTETNVPKSTDVLYALISSMTHYAKEHKDDLARIENSIRYATNLPADFASVLMKDYLYIEPGYKNKLMKVPAFQNWMMKKGVLLNGIVD